MESSILGLILNDLLLLILFYVSVCEEKFTFRMNVCVLIMDAMKCCPIVVDSL